MHVIASLLAAAFLIIQAQLWFGKGGIPRVWQMQKELAQAKAANEAARRRKADLEEEIRDLRDGRELMEERARMELRWIKEGELFFHYCKVGADKAQGRTPTNGASSTQHSICSE